MRSFMLGAAFLAVWLVAAAGVLRGGEPSRDTRWAFRPPERPPVPRVRDPAAWRGPIDAFILARLEAQALPASPEAERATLARRAALDLTGLPLEPAQLEAFLSDQRPDAYERVVDALLASVHFGERWGRHWLDLARYADSNGYTRDFGRSIWRYRDWVIDAFNRDLPFDRFTIEQLAGDLVPDADLSTRIATGFHRNTLINEEGGTDAEQFRVEAVADRVDTTGSVFLGLTLGCARCHDHKFDPIATREYYELFAVFNGCDELTIDAPRPEAIARGDLERRDALHAEIAAIEAGLEAREEELRARQREWELTVTPQQRARLPGPTQAALDTAPAARSAAEWGILRRVYQRTDAARAAFPDFERMAALRAGEPEIPTTLVLAPRAEPRETHVHRRGNFLDPGERVSPAVPAVLPPLSPRPSRAASEPDRLDFARWLVDGRNPLTARVIANRIWQRLFGRGIVETENDFGSQGEPPTHPELLDWLATELVQHEWSLKRFLRTVVTSRTYRQASRARADLARADPANRFLARQRRLRLEAEIIRDSALVVSGLLSRTIGGPSVFPPQPEGVFDFTQDPKPWETATGADRFRRGMYTHFWRSSPHPHLMVFDFPESNGTCTRRVRSNTPLQALTLANGVAFVECARALAQRVLTEPAEDTDTRVRYLFRLALAREPKPPEVARLHQLLEDERRAFAADEDAAARLVADEPPGAPAVERAAWTAVARVLLNLDEFITRE